MKCPNTLFYSYLFCKDFVSKVGVKKKEERSRYREIEEEREKENLLSSRLFFRCPNTSGQGKAKNSISVYHMGGRDPDSPGMVCCSEAHEQKDASETRTSLHSKLVLP